MHQILVENPLLLLFLVAALGYPLGKLRLCGISLGVASVLFSGLFFGALDPAFKLPEIIYVLGLGLFVYTVGLASGPAFFSSLRHHGIRYNLLVAGGLALAAACALGLAHLLGLKSTLLAGMYAGAFTNTPALAGAIETVKHLAPANMVERLATEPVVGYSISYPMGVLGMVLVMAFMQRFWHVDYGAEAKSLHVFGGGEELENWTLRVGQAEGTAATIGDLVRNNGWDVIFGRIRHGGIDRLARLDDCLEMNDRVTVIGRAEELEKVADYLGWRSDEPIDVDRSALDYRRIFVSNPEAAGKTIGDLKLMERFGAVITRVRRGDDDFVANNGMVLELGDRVRVLTNRERMSEVTTFFGDSYRAVSEMDILTFSLGLAIGLAVGMIPIPLPGGVVLKLGFAGGPLIVSLVLGYYGRTGPLVWSLPYSTTITLRQIGLVIFLAGIGTRAGSGFLTTFSSGGGVSLLIAGAILTCLTSLVFLWLGYRIMKIPMSILIGMLSGLQTQPALLAWSQEQTGNDLPNTGYASVYPMAMIAKILIVQLLLALGP